MESWVLFLICDFTFSKPWQRHMVHMSLNFLLCNMKEYDQRIFYDSSVSNILFFQYVQNCAAFCGDRRRYVLGYIFSSVLSLFENIIHIIFMNGKEKRNISNIKKYSKMSSHLFPPNISTDGKRKKMQFSIPS